MRWISTLLLAVICTSAHAQWYTVNFDDTSYKRYVFIDTINCHHNLWQIGKPHKAVFDSASSTTNVIVTDTSLPYAANDTSVFMLKVPKYSHNIGEMPVLFSLQFYYWLNLDSNTKAKIEFSGDDGLTWKDILRDSVDYLEWEGSDGYHVKPNFDTSTHGWKRFEVFSDFTNGSSIDTTLFRFTFISGNNDSARDGWMIDNIQALYYIEGVADVASGKQQNIFPNPATKELSISTATGTIRSVAINNLVGQTLYSKNYDGEKQIQIDISQLPPGAYTAKINGSDVRRFVKL